MLSGTGGGMFLISIIAGNLFIYAVMQLYNEAFGAIRNKRRKVDAIICTFIAIGFLLYFKVTLNEMDIPNVFSMNHEEVKGIVLDYKIEVGKGGKNIVDVRDNKTGKIFRFSYVDIPSELRRGDSVKMRYLRHNKMGAFAEINGKKMKYYVYHFGEYAVGAVLITFLLLSMPVYYFWIYRVKPVTKYKITYTAYVYHDLYIKVMKILYLFMLQTALVLIIALRGNYRTLWDWYWGILLLADYAGVVGLSFLRQKQFIILEDRFYYCNFKKRVEGNLSEIKSVESSDCGVIICTKEVEMEVLCTSKRYRETLLGKLPQVGECEDGTL